MAEVRTRDEAIAAVDQALAMWCTNLTGVLEQAQRTVQVARVEAESGVRQRAAKVAAIEAALRAADQREQAQLRSKLVRAQDEHQTAVRASVRVSDVAAGLAQLRQTHVRIASANVERARAALMSMSQALEGYRSGRIGLGGEGSSGRAAGSTVSVGHAPLASLGLSELDVGSADLNDNPVLDDNGVGGTFGKGGLSRADYRWAVQTWNDTVGPGIAGGKTREDFERRDAQTNARPLRRTADVYDMFVGGDRIRADRRPDGTLDITNGRHRLLIARELGIKSLPGQVT